MAKANKDGWIRNRGKCPVEKGTLVDVKYRCGRIEYAIPAMDNPEYTSQCKAMEWSNSGYSMDIMQWRLSKQEESTVHKGEAVIPAPSPLIWRDQVRESKAKIAELEKLISDQKKLIAEAEKKLNTEGFALVDVPQDDMSNPKNWRAGDVIECISIDGMTDMTLEGLYEIYRIEYEDALYIHVRDDVKFLACRKVKEFDSRFKFHSRPAK